MIDSWMIYEIPQFLSTQKDKQSNYLKDLDLYLMLYYTFDLFVKSLYFLQHLFCHQITKWYYNSFTFSQRMLMYNLGSLTKAQNQYELFDDPQEEQRKFHTPYVLPQDRQEQSSNIKLIQGKIEFTSHDIALAKKAKSRKTKTIQDPSNSNKKCGHWSSDQNKRYHWFLELHHQHFFNKHLRRTDRIFKSMATSVQTREAEQCRSHHQKMQKKYKYFSKILMSLRLQNYSSDDHELILFDIRQKGIPINDNDILSTSQLKQSSQSNLEQLSNQSGQLKPFRRKSSKTDYCIMNIATGVQIENNNLCEQENKQQQQQENFDILFGYRDNPINNILNDKYEECFNINNMELEMQECFMRDRE